MGFKKIGRIPVGFIKISDVVKGGNKKMKPIKREEEAAAFNMAIDTLQRLGEILREIKVVSANPYLTSEVRQETKIILVKQFYVQAVPLLSIEFKEKYQDMFLNLKPSNKKHINPSTKKYEGMKVTIFDPLLDSYMDSLLIAAQTDLQRHKYFMPSSKNPKFGWGQGD